jgi:predicted nucleic acid-binding protein
MTRAASLTRDANPPMSELRFTIDASVVGDVLFEDRFTRHARAVVGSAHELFASEQLTVEMLSIVSTRVARGQLPPEDAAEVFEHGCRLPLALTPIRSTAAMALKLSSAMRHSVYDCLYLAVAMERGAPLVTADRRLCGAATAAGLGARVLWIEDAL